jgi:glycosyltransferase involved in cell wall biosynthesis
MRILHVVPSYLPAWRYGGPIRSVHGLCKNLIELGHEVHVYTTDVDGTDRLNVPIGMPVNIDGVWVTYFPVTKVLRRLYFSPKMKIALLKNIKHFDFLHLHSIFLWPTYIASRIASKQSKPYAISLRGMLVKDLFRRKSYIIKNIWLFLIERMSLENASFIHVTTPLEKTEASKFRLFIKSYVLIPNGVDSFENEDITDSVNANMAEEWSRFNPYILFVGRIDRKKGLDRLIRAFSQIGDSINLLIAGNDDANLIEELDAIISSHSLKSRVFFLGEVRGKRKSNLYKFARLLVLPSYSENFGNVLLESLYMGCPVATTKDVGLHDQLVDSGVAISLPDDIAAMGKCLREIMVDEMRLKRMGKKGKNLVTKEYNWKEISTKMERAYMNSLSQKSL